MRIKQSLLGLFIGTKIISTIISISAIGIFIIPKNIPLIGGLHPIIYIIFSIFFSILSIIYQYTKVYYELSTQDITIHSGLLTKNIEIIPFEKVASINSNQPLFLRLLNFHEVRIDTNDTDSDYDNLVISNEHYNIIQEYKYNFDTSHLETEEEKNISKQCLNEYKVDSLNLFKFSISKANIFVALIIIFGLYETISEFIGDNIINSASLSIQSLNLVSAVIVAIITVIILIVISLFNTMFKYYDYTITKYHSNYKISYGLFSKHNYTLQYNSIFGIVIKQTIIGRLLGLCEIAVINSGYGLDEDENSEPYLIIALPIKEVSSFLNEMLPEFNTYQEGKQPIFKAYIPGFILNTLIILLVTTLIYNFSGISFFPLLVIALIAFISNIISLFFKVKYNRLGFDDTKLYCTNIELNFLFFTHKRYIIKSNSLLLVRQKINPIQRAYQVSNININMHSDSIKEVNLTIHHYPIEYYNKIKDYLIIINS